MIEVKNVTFHYGIHPVLRGVSCSIRRGEVVALMGPNGMGKSTLMAVIAGAIAPLKGSVEINGLVRRSSADVELQIRKQVIYLPASPWLPGALTGREWVIGVARTWSIDEDRLMDHADRLLSLFDLAGVADSPISACSTGQQKKIAIAGALITEAPIMLLDEPFAGGLDPSGIMALRRVLQHRAAGDHYTIVFATPVPELVEELADRVAIIKDGKIVAFDSVAGLREQSKIDGKLDELYERLVNPQTVGNIDRYLAAEGS